MRSDGWKEVDWKILVAFSRSLTNAVCAKQSAHVVVTDDLPDPMIGDVGPASWGTPVWGSERFTSLTSFVVARTAQFGREVQQLSIYRGKS
jgi:hypothetical protein